MAVCYDGTVHHVLDKGDDYVTFSHTAEKISVSEIEPAEYKFPDWKPYNNKIREVNSRYNGRFVKNESREIYENGDHIWFTSDTHFCHDNIIRFCGRPYSDVKEMNKALVDKWNKMIKPDDIVYHLGDFCFGGSSNWEWVIKHLNGHIHLIVGNHDVKNLRQGYMQYFESVSFQKQIIIEGRAIYLNHYPFLTYGGIYRKDSDKVWQLFGHVHSKNGMTGQDSGRLQYLLPTQYDVGVDNNDFMPVSWKEVKATIERQVEMSKKIENNTKENTTNQKNRVVSRYIRILNILWQEYKYGTYKREIMIPDDEIESFKNMEVSEFEFDSLDQTEYLIEIEGTFDVKFKNFDDTINMMFGGVGVYDDIVRNTISILDDMGIE